MENNINQIIATNITKNRKHIGITQLELAEKLNYSDKAVSKWERGESIPDINILLELAGIFGITLNDLCYAEPKSSKIVVPQNSKTKHLYITLLSFGLVWLIATAVFALLLAFAPNVSNRWLCFIYAIPVSAIVLVIFNSLWGKTIWNCLYVSFIIWGILVSICVTANSTAINWLYLIGIPLEILTIIWFFFKTRIIETFHQLKHKKDIK